MLSFVLLVGLIGCLLVIADLSLSTGKKELWKEYALACEAELDCRNDYDFEADLQIPGEGCMTRARRLQRIEEQRVNAAVAALNAKEKLVKEGEYV